MRENISLTVEEEIVKVLKSRAERKHQSVSRYAEDIFRKALRL